MSGTLKAVSLTAITCQKALLHFIINPPGMTLANKTQKINIERTFDSIINSIETK